MPQATDPCQPAIDSKLIAGFTTNYDKAGNKLYERHLHSECRSHTYQMDAANRLSQYQRGKLSDPGPWPTSPPTPSTSLGLPKAFSQVHYNLDMLGNWNNPSFTPADGSTPPNESREHNALNQITQQAGNNFTYDLNGNLLNDGKLRYEYDAINRLKRVYKVASDGIPEQQLVEYWYDALGRRIKRDIKDLGGGAGGVTGTVKDGVTYFSYAGQQCVEEREGTNTNAPARQYIWGHNIDELVQQREYNTPTGTCDLYPIHDLHNRAVALTDPSGAIIETYDTDAYGRTLVFNNPGLDATWFSDDDQQVPTPLCRFIYTGREYDAETGMYFYRARFYSAEIGRFISRDPISYGGGNLNLYALTSNNPSNRFDPMGTYDTAGHFWTVYMTGVASGMNKRDAYRLAYYSQLPDQIKAFDAESAAENASLNVLELIVRQHFRATTFQNILQITNNLAWDYKVENLLHSLVNGTKADLLNRRHRLSFLLQQYPNMPIWEKGFILHAYGDTFAHEDANGNPYRPLLGHAKEFHVPDAIGQSPLNYKRYVVGLSSLLASGKTSNMKLSKMMALAATFQVPTWPSFDLAWPGGQETSIENRQMEALARAKFGYSWSYIPNDSYNIKPKLGPPPTRAQVQRLMDFISGARQTP